MMATILKSHSVLCLLPEVQAEIAAVSVTNAEPGTPEKDK